jgi:cell division protein FtsZ
MQGARIKVLGLGGGGSNAVDRMMQVGIEGIEYIAANTDAQALARTICPTRVQLGPRVTRGLGAGGDPARGLAAARESAGELGAGLRGADMVFLAAGLGGGTGTGAISCAAEIARDLGSLVVAIVTMPFSFEGGRRQRQAREGLARLQPLVNTLIVVPNDRLLQIVPREMPFEMAFQIADEALRQGVQGLAELVTRPGLINLDFAHVRHLMATSGGALLAMGQGSGEDKAVKAAHAALHHPLLAIGEIDQASGLLVHITGGEDLGLFEVREAIEVLTEAAHPRAEVIFGAAIDPSLNGRAELILIATGLGGTAVDVPAKRDAIERAVERAAERRAAREAQGAGERAPEPAVVAVAVPAEPPERDDLDIPAFVRRRAANGARSLGAPLGTHVGGLGPLQPPAMESA